MQFEVLGPIRIEAMGRTQKIICVPDIYIISQEMFHSDKPKLFISHKFDCVFAAEQRRVCYFCKSNRGLRCPGKLMWLPITLNSNPQRSYTMERDRVLLTKVLTER